MAAATGDHVSVQLTYTSAQGFRQAVTFRSVTSADTDLLIAALNQLDPRVAPVIVNTAIVL